MITLFRIN